jgi:hypothetical protein
MDNSGARAMAEHDHDRRLISAYERMLERLRHDGAEAGKAPRLTRLLEAAKDRAVELGELSREEAERIGEYLRRDIEDAAAFLAGDRESELLDWLRLDLEIVEKRLLDLFSSVADRTRFELLELEMQARAADAAEYRTGQITGIGTLQCPECHHTVRFHATGRIPPCPGCHGTVFVRTGSAPD